MCGHWFFAATVGIPLKRFGADLARWVVVGLILNLFKTGRTGRQIE